MEKIIDPSIKYKQDALQRELEEYKTWPIVEKYEDGGVKLVEDPIDPDSRVVIIRPNPRYDFDCWMEESSYTDGERIPPIIIEKQNFTYKSEIGLPPQFGDDD